MTRIIVEMEVDYWNAGCRKLLRQFIIHNFTKEVLPQGDIIEPKQPYPIIPLAPEDECFHLEW